MHIKDDWIQVKDEPRELEPVLEKQAHLFDEHNIRNIPGPPEWVKDFLEFPTNEDSEKKKIGGGYEIKD